MKPLTASLLAALAAVAGYAAGAYRTSPPSAPPAGSGSAHSAPGVPAGVAAADSGQPEPDAAASDAALESRVRDAIAEMERVGALSDADFGKWMADAWLDHGNPDSHLRRAIGLATCNAQQATAFYLEYKRRKGIALTDDAGELREFFTIIGSRDAKGFLNALFAVAPDGVSEMESLVHGWAAASPQEAVDRVNAIPDGAPWYERSLVGVVWGLAQSSPDTALAVFRDLAPGFRNEHTRYSLANSVVMNHGMAGLNRVLDEVDDPQEAQLLLQAGMDFGRREPPAEFVREMAGRVEANPAVRHQYEIMSSRWVAVAPQDATDWLTATAGQAGFDAALVPVAFALAKTGQVAAVETWVAAHPDAPGATAIAAGITSAKLSSGP